MHLTAERFDARSWPDDQLDTLFGGAFPAFITADQVAKQYIGRVREWFPELNIILTGDDQVPAATGWGVPIRWNGHVPDLPAGYTDTTKRAVEGRERAEAPDTFVICGGIVSPALAGRGLAGPLITALRDLAPAAGCERVLAPVRPTLNPADPHRHVRALDAAGRRSARSLAAHPLAARRPDHCHRTRLADDDRNGR